MPRPHRLRYALAVALPWFFSAPLAWASPVSDDDDLALSYSEAASVSIATGNSQSLRRAPAVASVITAADIVAMGATELDQILETVPGIHVNRAPNSNSPLYVVRGIVSAFNPQVLLLQNGIPITTAYMGNKGNIWGAYPVEHIARIEILRGPGSALYGSDAYAGVINIITKNAAEVGGTEFGLRGASFGTGDLWFQQGTRLGPLAVASYLRYGQTDGNHNLVESDAQSRNDKLFNTHATLAPGQINNQLKAVDGNLDLQFGVWRARFGYKRRYDMGTGLGIAWSLDPTGRQQTERITSSLSWADAQLAHDWGAGATLSSQQYSQEIPTWFRLMPAGLVYPTGAFPNGMIAAPETWERTYRASAYADYSGWQLHRLRLGVGHDDIDMYRTREYRNFNYAANGMPIPLPSVIETSASSPFIRPQRRNINYLYLQDEWNLAADWNLTAGLRHDRYSDFGSTTNPRLALVWDASYDLTAKLLYGRAFRAPAFVESYGISNPVALGNPLLKPERNATTELALAWQLSSNASFNLTFYHYSMHDIIRAVMNPVAGTGSTYANTGDQRGDGLELEGKWQLTSTVQFSGNYAWQRSIDQRTGTDAGAAPRHHLLGRIDWSVVTDYQLGAQLNHVAGRRRPLGDLRAPIADYSTADFTIATRYGRQRWNYTLAIRNAFNANVREPSPAPGLALPGDIPMPGRNISLQASYQM
ncbi:TonB-dependent receptor plug domain-containing protein [Pseudoduganella danionis]|uniref:TonB-dependent receptor n=1 Tax=Pseudoduganella danionis TaxID=1890295 RepID=A0ABW9SSU6_9BURK|nr:TonB-dependent receptor [Pseudoduganella danionis]MTW34671.1 TonB-dependent receptor [Pseudoduganella danionis]